MLQKIIKWKKSLVLQGPYTDHSLQHVTQIAKLFWFRWLCLSSATHHSEQAMQSPTADRTDVHIDINTIKGAQTCAPHVAPLTTSRAQNGVHANPAIAYSTWALSRWCRCLVLFSGYQKLLFTNVDSYTHSSMALLYASNISSILL